MPVRVEGAVALRKALRKFEPDLAKETTKKMGIALKPIVVKSRGYLPSENSMLSNWRKSNAKESWLFPVYDYAIAKSGVKYKTTPSKPNSKGFRSLASIMNTNAAAAIYETAGRKKSDSVFVRNLIGKTGGRMLGSGKKMGRVIFRAWDEDQGKAQDAVLKAIEASAKKFEVATSGKY